VQILNRLVTVLFVETTILCLISAFQFVDIQSTAILVIFNALFLSIMFRLHGSLNKKLLLLFLGNATGLFWNYLFHSFAITASVSFQNFSIIYTLVYPFLNSLWVICFWSLSLTALQRQNIHGKLSF
jgi:hypothetical protein